MSERGFGLLEMLFALALGSFVCLGALGLLDASARSLRASETALASLETQQVALGSLGTSLRRARGNLCGSGAVWRNHLVLSDSSWWSRVRSGSYVYALSEAAPGTAFGVTAARRVAGTAAIDVFYVERNGGDLVSQEAPAAELRVSSIQDYSAGDVAVVCSPASTDVFMVTGTPLGRLLHDATTVNALGLRNCGGSFFGGDACTGAPRCVAGRVSGAGCPLPSELVASVLGHVRGERWYIGFNASGEKALYMAQLENTGVSGTPTAVRPNEIVSGVNELAFFTSRVGGWAPLGSAAVPVDGSAIQVALRLADGRWMRRFVEVGGVVL